jgi:hypothetical protein
MLARFNLLVIATVFGGVALLAQPALAQGDEEDDAALEDEDSADDGTEEDAEMGEGEGDEEGADEAKEEKVTVQEEVAEDAARTDSSPVELPGKTYYFVGPRLRWIIVPKFMINLFGDGGQTVNVWGLGPELGVRKDGFEYIFSLWYADYGMGETPFKAKDDERDAWEIVKSEIKVIYLTADFQWSHDFAPEFALNYGMGAGLGIVFGNLYRTQATPSYGGDINDPYSWDKCTGEGAGLYCGGDNDHYDGYTEPSWSGGGSKPIIFPWFALQTGTSRTATSQPDSIWGSERAGSTSAWVSTTGSRLLRRTWICSCPVATNRSPAWGRVGAARSGRCAIDMQTSALRSNFWQTMRVSRRWPRWCARPWRCPAWKVWESRESSVSGGCLAAAARSWFASWWTETACWGSSRPAIKWVAPWRRWRWPLVSSPNCTETGYYMVTSSPRTSSCSRTDEPH